MPRFQPYDPRGTVRQTRRNLPHWEQPGATYFVTFRLADSLPSEARARLNELRELNESDAFAWIDRYLDAGAGSCLLAHPAHAPIVASALRHFDGRRYALGAFVVMPNHVHALVQPLAPQTRETIVHSWKSFTAHELHRTAGIRGAVWQEEGFDRIVRNEIELQRYNDYILANPTAAHLREGSFLVGEGTARWFE